ncbi:calcium-binding protein [Rubellimicrobium rubrum]|uniref:Calcium-binding protein n=1 Tax=Rubellimicrobium rubrum TaxID=2585369 RepID=A0A5C4MPI0_9RHOB|nr:calcium-binding protein [Rubellimicrobium rubrum]TNC45932.1 calcium-binding protein [Rubellimicrobium rubrum]
MAKIAFYALGYDVSSAIDLISYFDESTLVQSSSSQVTVDSISFRFIVTGTGLVASGTGGGVQLTGGTITQIRVRGFGPESSSPIFTISDLNEPSSLLTGEIWKNLYALDWFFEGGPNSDTFGSSWHTGDITIHLHAGSDVGSGSSGNDTIYGGSGDDRLYGQGGADLLYGGKDGGSLFGGEGEDRIHVEDGWAEVFAGSGNDRIWAGSTPMAADLHGDAGNDTFYFGVGSNMAYGGAGNDWFNGGSGYLHARGGDGDDRMDGGGWVDLLQGEAGNDLIIGGTGEDCLFGGAGQDKVLGGSENDILSGGFQNDNLAGDAGMDTLAGDSGDDQLRGGTGDDELRSGTGNDRLIGGAGKDLLFGGGDDKGDHFVFDWRSDSRVGGGRDLIFNFTKGSDTIDLEGIDCRPASDVDNDFAWSGKTSANYSVWFEVVELGILVRADVTGDAKADFEVLVKGLTSISSGDFDL